MYETHITVNCADPAALSAWAAGAGLKLTVIELSGGRMPTQPMLTLGGSESYTAERARVEETVTALRAAGFAPVRVKVESAPWAPEVPDGPCGGAQYFEHHVKLLLRPDALLPELAALVSPFGARLSWNARRVRTGSWHERFVTQRCRGVDAAGAGTSTPGSVNRPGGSGSCRPLCGQSPVRASRRSSSSIRR